MKCPFENGKDFLELIYAKDYYTYIFTNPYGDSFVARIDLKTFNIWWTGSEVNWEWGYILINDNSHVYRNSFMNFLFNKEVIKWMTSVTDMALYLKAEKEKLKNG